MWDFRPENFRETRDQRPRTHLMNQTWDPRPWTLEVGPETQDLEPNL